MYFCSEEYHVVSTADLADWEMHGTALEGLGSTIQMRPSTPDEWSNPTPFIRKMLDSIDHVAEKEKFETAPEQ